MIDSILPNSVCTALILGFFEGPDIREAFGGLNSELQAATANKTQISVTCNGIQTTLELEIFNSSDNELCSTESGTAGHRGTYFCHMCKATLADLSSCSLQSCFPSRDLKEMATMASNLKSIGDSKKQDCLVFRIVSSHQ